MKYRFDMSDLGEYLENVKLAFDGLKSAISLVKEAKGALSED